MNKFFASLMKNIFLRKGCNHINIFLYICREL